MVESALMDVWIMMSPLQHTGSFSVSIIMMMIALSFNHSFSTGKLLYFTTEV